LIAWMPGKIAAGKVSTADVASIDWFPTLVSMTALTSTLSPEHHAMLRGRDASGILFAPNNNNDNAAAGVPVVHARKHPLAWDYRMSMPGTVRAFDRSLRSRMPLVPRVLACSEQTCDHILSSVHYFYRRYHRKLCRTTEGKCYHQSPRLALLEPETGLKLLMHPDRSRLELYNVSMDVFEANNLAALMPKVVDAMAATLMAWSAAMPASPPGSVYLNPGCVANAGHQSTAPDGENADERYGARLRQKITLEGCHWSHACSA
jgi:arylsulfatase A-like enzyme